MTKRQKIALILNILAFVLGGIGIIVRVARDIPHFWLYYTQISNVAAVISSAMYIAFRNTDDPRLAAAVRGCRYLSACGLTMTFMVVTFIFLPFGTPESAEMLAGHLNGILHHFVCPVISVASYIFFEDGVRSRRSVLIPFCATAVYAFTMYALNYLRLAPAPYPFFAVYDYPLWELVVWFFGLMLLVATIAAAVRLANIKANKKEKET
ncbi:MAG: hypothetical protein J6N15_08155 [Ruminiclostridium sp.]|nr:hypothetical protein [Ruminiclostridium sp.]